MQLSTKVLNFAIILIMTNKVKIGLFCISLQQLLYRQSNSLKISLLKTRVYVQFINNSKYESALKKFNICSYIETEKIQIVMSYWNVKQSVLSLNKRCSINFLLLTLSYTAKNDPWTSQFILRRLIFISYLSFHRPYPVQKTENFKN